MNFLSLRSAHVSRAALRTRVYRPTTTIPQRFAHQSYGGDESGHPKTDAPNKAVDKEHPGPKAPDTSSKSSSSGSSQNTATSHKQSSGDKSPSASGSKTKDGKEPAILHPDPAPEEQNDDVKKHNEEMAHRYEKSVNQLDEEGKVEKVDKGFWKEHTGH